MTVTENSDQLVTVTENSDQLVAVTENSDQLENVTENSDQLVSVTENSDQLVTVTENSDHFTIRHWTVCVFTVRYENMLFCFNGSTAPVVPGSPHYRNFAITLRHTTVGRSPLDEWSAPRTDLYLTTHNTHKTQTFMPPALEGGGWFRTCNPSKQRVPEPRLWPRGRHFQPSS